METLFAQHGVAIAISAAIALFILLYNFSDPFKFKVVDFLVTLPYVGSISRLSKDTSPSSNAGWLQAEETLCAKYKPFVTLIDEQTFKQRLAYLALAGDSGRTPVPLYMIGIIFVLVIAEGLGFGFMLSTWMAKEASASMLDVLTIAVSTVVAIIMVFITHAAGHQIFRTGLLRSSWKAAKTKKVDYFTAPVGSDNPQEVDADKDNFVRLSNRVATAGSDRGSYAWVVVAVIATCVIAIGSTVMRVNALGKEQTLETKSEVTNPYAGFPGEVAAPSAEVKSQADKEADSYERSEGMAAFVVLGAIFVITQIVGVGTGLKYGFAGKTSKDAYREIKGFYTYSSYLTAMQPLRDIGQRRLKELQQKIEASSPSPIRLTKRFDDYLIDNRTRAIPSADALGAVSSAAPAGGQPQAAITVAQAIAEITRLNDREKEKAYAENYLPKEVLESTEFLNFLKERKKERDARIAAERARELSDLF